MSVAAVRAKRTARLRRSLAPALALACLLAAVGAAAAGAVGLDRGYGDDGVAEVSVSGPGLKYPLPHQMASARQGDVYVLADSHLCGVSCGGSFALFRYLGDGSRDEGFAGAGALALPASGLGYAISVDGRGRPLAAAIEPDAIVLRRYGGDGRLDASFGAGGSARIPCDCTEAAVTVAPARRGRILVVAGGPTAASTRQRPSARAVLTRLLPGGRVDPGFGRRGRVAVRLTGVGALGPLAVSARGAVLLAGSGCCTAANTYAIRVSARGRLDTRFRTTARLALRRLARFGEFPEVRSVLPRRDGTVDLLGVSQFERGFDLRLRADGRLAAGFGRRGAVSLPLPVGTASLGTRGAIVAANERGSGTVFRIFRDGRLDPAFGGAAGIEVPRTSVAGGLVIAAQAGGRALLMDLGLHVCRSSCPSTPRLTAFREGPARR